MLGLLPSQHVALVHWIDGVAAQLVARLLSGMSHGTEAVLAIRYPYQHPSCSCYIDSSNLMWIGRQLCVCRYLVSKD
jgi:hypothetical protein